MGVYCMSDTLFLLSHLTLNVFHILDEQTGEKLSLREIKQVLDSKASRQGWYLNRGLTR